MPVVSTDSGPAAPPPPSTKRAPTSLLAALGRMRWDEALAVVMASDPYYHYSPPSKNDETAKAGASTTSDKNAVPAPQVRWLRRYLLSSSTTRLLIHAGTAGYLFYVVSHPSRYVPCRVVVANADAATTDCFLYQSAEGMQLLMRSAMPKPCVLLHAVAGSLLLPLAILQKELIWQMPFSRKAVVDVGPMTNEDDARHSGDAQAQSAAKRSQLRKARESRRYHSKCGFLMGACVAAMVVGGVSLRSYSVFASAAASSRAGILNFSIGIAIFAAPWVVLMPAVMLSCIGAKAAAHALLGGVLTKAILAVPFERMLGGIWQRLAGAVVHLPPQRQFKAGAAPEGVRLEVAQHVEGALERVYYKSILVTTIVFGVWGVADIVRFVRVARQCVAADAKSPKST
ncbi:hypothetical protein ABL78_5731 [Leptomonas seymouri]|uniref:Uncharacterized protein n=1 Tax=Leptomonas seymouri TaxID=5684 RepID=A0A0N1HUR6_LEPSE|nr:hypothetical protein ABL78_5731 [Leptomonas seymouri]|eukprot:KPI85223.1 hypothetical protein ABL78_5731 [Leptomonas seymouri]